MNKFVIQSDEVLEVGKIYRGKLSDPWARDLRELRYLVKARTTREEWQKFAVSMGVDKDWTEHYSLYSPHFYYEVDEF